MEGSDGLIWHHERLLCRRLLSAVSTLPVFPTIRRWHLLRHLIGRRAFGAKPSSIMCCKNFRRGIHALMLVEEGANILGKLPVLRLPGSVERIGSLLIGTAYLLPARRADDDERRQLVLPPRDGDGLFVSAPVSIRDPAAAFGAQSCP